MCEKSFEMAAALVFDVPPSWLTNCEPAKLSVLLTPHSSTGPLMFLTRSDTAVTSVLVGLRG